MGQAAVCCRCAAAGRRCGRLSRRSCTAMAWPSSPCNRRAKKSSCLKATRKVARINNFWRALATNPEHLESVWRHLKTVMKPGRLDLLTKEMIAVAVSSTNGCAYCVNSHIAAAQKLGMDTEMLGELM